MNEQAQQIMSQKKDEDDTSPQPPQVSKKSIHDFTRHDHTNKTDTHHTNETHTTLEHASGESRSSN